MKNILLFLKDRKTHCTARLGRIMAAALVGMSFLSNAYLDNASSLLASTATNDLNLISGKTTTEGRPAGYNEDEAKKLLYSYSYSNIPNKKKVNVISIMLESFSDFSGFKQFNFKIDPYKYLHQLEAQSYSGEIVTNIFGCCTVVTERNFYTGYTTLTDKTEFSGNENSYVRYFKEQGYNVEGSHPCYERFYDRGKMNKYLGFNNYYLYENYYGKLSKDVIAPDNILFPEMIKLYEKNKKTGKPYFSANVTYQNHGPVKYKKLTNAEYVVNKGYSQGEYNVINNYFDGIYDTTKQIKKLITYFKAQKEPVVVILFGDHKPILGKDNVVYKTLGIKFDLNTPEGFYSYYNTPYVIWGNDSAKKVLGNEIKGKGPQIGPYFLMNEFFNLAGYGGNEFMKLSNSVKSVVDVISYKGRYKESGVLKSTVSPKAQKKLQDFFKAQYYWMNNFRSNPPDKK